MFANLSRFRKTVLGAATMLAGLTVTACVAQYSEPQQVDSSKPTVTYKYSSDDELIQANQRAATYCNQYNFAPRTVSLSNDPDGSKIVVFECTASAMPMAPPPTNPNLTYSYRSDQELLNASRSAQVYCMNNGSRQMISNIVTNTNGTRTVTFQCSQG